MIEINKILDNLAKKRPVFHSEADFQHALAWEIHQCLPNADIRLELPVHVGGLYLHIDIWIVSQDGISAVELKYKTRSLSIHVDNEQYLLKNQSAQDIGRYDFIKDIQRLEHVVGTYSNCDGYAILLTNDNSYWSKPASRDTVDSDFRLNDGRSLEGILNWGVGASDGTKKDREQPLTLQNKYSVRWEDFAQINLANYGAFRSLKIMVSKGSKAG